MEDHQKPETIEDIKDDTALWDKEDDKYLKTLVSIHGNHDWSTISTSMNFTFPSKHRTTQECKERWYTQLDPAISKQPWTDQEELEMLIAHQKHQNKWSDVSQALHGRSNNTVKNRFYSVFRKVKNKIKRRELNYGSKLELLEIFYMISLMEFYFTHPQPATEQKGKRGKDFIYSLLRTLRLEDVLKYKLDLQKQGSKETTLEELWLELASQDANAKNGVQDPKIGEVKSMGLFSYISEPPSNERSHYVLPMPHVNPRPERLTPDEKDFIQSQVFRNSEPFSAGTYFCQPMMMSPPTYRPAPFSAGRPRFVAPMPRYEAFSDFTEGAIQLSNQPRAQQTRPQTFLYSPGMRQMVPSPPPDQVPQYIFPVSMFRQSPF